jgi:hypothetical protein
MDSTWGNKLVKFGRCKALKRYSRESGRDTSPQTSPTLLLPGIITTLKKKNFKGLFLRALCDLDSSAGMTGKIFIRTVLRNPRATETVVKKYHNVRCITARKSNLI